MSAPASDLFFALTPERVLQAVDGAGLPCRNVCYPLNSFENRVYEVELEDRQRVVAKFYRPGRWSREQIVEEHEFLAELEADEIPVCAARPFPGGDTLRERDGIFYAIFERKGGRAPDELDESLAKRLGMLTGRVHSVGARRPARHRLALDAEHFVRREVAFLAAGDWVPVVFWPRYEDAALALADLYEERARSVEKIRIHADLHLGNVLLRDGLLRLLDFDDFAVGPPVQDVWLSIPGRDAWNLSLRESFLQGYEQFRAFDRPSLALIEPLRGLRVVRYAAWIARRWHDPIFPATWSHFGTEEYWKKETEDLEEILRMARRAGALATESGAPKAAVPPEATETELTNKDFFWDWEG
jgi:Ser/Thr protein kinase RdoA (MazF antagonist)